MQGKTKRPYEPEDLAPRNRLLANVTDLIATNLLSTQRTCELARDFHAVDSSSLPSLARPDAKKNIARNVRRRLAKHSCWMPVYWAQVRVKVVKTQKTRLEWIAINLPHEIAHVLKKLSIRDALLQTEGLDPLTRKHLEECEVETGAKLLALGIWADGTPCNWDRSETVETMSLSLPGLLGADKNLRIPITAISKKHVCGETWHDICAIVKWSLDILETGEWPTCRHDNTDWLATDVKRKKALPIPRGILAEVRADWDWMAGCYGFPTHRIAIGNCWICDAKPSTVMGFSHGDCITCILT